MAVGSWLLVGGEWRLSVGGPKGTIFRVGQKNTQNIFKPIVLFISMLNHFIQNVKALFYILSSNLFHFLAFGVWRLAVGMRVGRKIENNNKLKNTKF